MKRTHGVRALGLVLMFLAMAQPAAADGMAVTLLDGGEAIGPPGLCPLDRVDLSAELTDDEATVRETRIYPVLDPAALLGPTGAPLETTAVPRVELFKSLHPGAELISLRIDGEDASGELLEPDAADDLRRELVLRLGDPAPLRELGMAMWVMDALELDAGQRTVEIVSEMRMPLVARGTLEGVSVPLDWHEGPVRSVGIDVHTTTDAPLRALYSPYHALQLNDRQEHEATASFSRSSVASAPPIEILRSTGEEAVRLDLLPFHHGDADEGGFLLALFVSMAVIGYVIDRDVVARMVQNGLGAKQDGGQLRYPHDLASGRDAPDAVKLLREILAGAEDGSIVFVQVGFSTNLANLLDSQPDDISSLSGVELVKQKSRLLSMMAGAFTQIRRNDGKLYDHKEFNVVMDIPAAQKLATEWPTPIVWSGFEIGLSTRYPHQSIERDYNYVKHHPLADAYRLYNPPPHDRPTWDLTSVLYAVRPNHAYFDLSESGQVQVADDSLTTFKPAEHGLHRYLRLTDEQRIRVTEALVQLSSQPPQH